MAERNDWDRNRDREQEMDRERGGHRLDTQRNRESRGYDTGRWENEGGGRYQGSYERDRESEGRGNYPRYEDRSRDYDRDYRGGEEYRDRAEWYGGSRTSDFGQRGDWGRQGNWGTYGNRPNYDERGQYSGQWSGGQSGGQQGNYGSQYGGQERSLGNPYGGRSSFSSQYGGRWQRDRGEDEGMQHNQLGGMSAGRSSGMWTSGAGGGYGSSYSGGMGSFSGGLGGRSESGRHTGRGPKNWQRSDDRIREEVNERLTDHPEIDATEIDVQVKNGEVTLTGTVDERRAKRLAEDIAEEISGVKEVHNQLRVQSGSTTGSQRQQGTEMAHSASGTTSTSTTQKK